MSDQQNVDKGRRNLLIATSVAGGVGGVAVAAPFVCTFAPSEKARAAGAPIEADVSDLAPGQMKVVEWRGKPVWLLKRTPEMLESLKKTDTEVADPKSDVPFTMKTPDYCKNETRSRAEHKDLLVVVGICSHLGCSPSGPFVSGANAQARRRSRLCLSLPRFHVRSGRPRLQEQAGAAEPGRPPYMFLSDTKLVIGKDEKGEA